MEQHLHFNVSQSRSSFEQNASTKPNGIPLSLEYACLQWTYHVSGLLASQPDSRANPGRGLQSRFRSWLNRDSLSSLQSKIDAEIASIFRPRLLFWLEVMSCLSQVQRAAAMLIFATAMVKKKELKQFLRDANSFVASSREAIERSAAHIYISALPFADKGSLVYRDFSPLCTGLVNVELLGIAHHAGRLVMTLTGHEGAVQSVAYCADGSLLVSGSVDGTVRIWDMRTGEETMTPLCSGDGAVLSVAFAPDAECVASGTGAGIVYVWPLLAALAIPQRLCGHSAAVSLVQFSPDGSLLASGSLDKTIRLWNTKTSQKIAVLRGHTARITAISFAPDSLTLVSGSEDHTIQLWDAATGKPSYSSPHRHDQPVNSVCFLPDGQATAAACGSNLILCKLQTGRKSKTVHTGSSFVQSIQPSPDGQSLVSAVDNSVLLLNLPRLTTRSSTVVLDGHTESVRAATFAPDGVYVASASDDRTIRVWNVSGKSGVLQPAENDNRVDGPAVSALIMSDARVLTKQADVVSSIAISRDCTFIVSGSHDFSVCVWDVRTADLKFPPLLGHTGEVYSVDVSSDDRMIASASNDKTIRLWDAQRGVSVGTPMQGHTSRVESVVFSSDARWIVSGSSDKTVIWDVALQQQSTVGLPMCTGMVNTVCFSPEGQLVAAGLDGGLIHLWDRATGRPVREPIQPADFRLWALAFSPDGKCIVSGGQSRGSNDCAYVWIISTGKSALSLKGHTEIVTSVKYSTNGRLIVTGSYDKTICLWDAETGARVATLRGHKYNVLSVAYAINGRFIASASNDRTIRVWSLTDPIWTHQVIDGDPSAMLSSANMDNGWLIGSGGELLLWLPTEYRRHFPKLRTDTRYVDITVGSSGWHRGESWTSCWRKATSDSPPPLLMLLPPALNV